MRNTGLKRWLDRSPPHFLVKSLSVLNSGFNNRGVKTIALSVAIFAASYNTVSYQDMQSLAFGEDRWLVHLPDGPGQSVAAASMSLTDPVITGAVISGDKLAQKNTRPVSADFDRLTTQTPQPPKAQTINRTMKGDRVISSTVQRPPAYFSAGSVLRRSSFLSPLRVDKKQSLAFLKAKPVGEAMKIASVFQIKIDKRKRDLKKLPVMVASLVRESESSILSYLPEPTVKYSPFAAVLRDESPVSIIPKLNRGDHPWADDPLPKESFSKKQQTCLATGIYFEARGEPARGQAAVAQVILNRVRNPAYPNSICGVVYQNKNLYNRCQFSFACDRKRDRVTNPPLWSLAKDIAKETTAGRIWLSQVGSSTHYHAVYVRPKWAKTMKRVGKIGLHIFYRTYGGGWS
ncbi:MAG: cell wall hydrolase [Rhizobiaceae bacterium]|nr:cell wall hydrolase [Rhizobiaceae bacterium]